MATKILQYLNIRFNDYAKLKIKSDLFLVY